MRLKRLLLMILTALLLVNSTACDSDGNKKVDADHSKTNNNLKIYYMDYDTKIQNALGIFKEKYKNVNVDDIIFSDTNEYKNKVTTDILSGEGPDVILIRPRWFGSLNKFVSSGVLCDLNEFIKVDKDFNMSDYNEKILNSFEQNGKRLIIPLHYGVNTLITSKEALHRSNIKVDPSNWNYHELLQVVKRFQEQNRGKNKYFFSEDFDISSLIKGSGISFIDFKNRKSFFNSKDFIEILEVYKGLYPSICTHEAVKGISVGNRLKNGIYIMSTDSQTSPSHISGNYSFYKSIGEELEVYPFPTLRGGNSIPISYTDYVVGINSQSNNKEAAYNFIKILMSKDLQKSIGTGNIIYETPINKNAYEEDFKYCMSKESLGNSCAISDKDSPIYYYSSVPLPKNIKTQIDNIVSRVDKCEIEDTEILSIVKEALPDFLNGKKTAAKTAKEIDEKVELYLNE